MGDLPEFRVATVHMNGSTTVELGGDVDLASAHLLAAKLEAVIDAAGGALTVDLAQVTFLDSSGLNVLVSAHRRLCAEGRPLTVRNPPATVARVFEVSGVAKVINVQGVIAPLAAD